MKFLTTIMLNFLKSNKEKLQIKFDKTWDAFVVIKNQSNILYTGSKEQCENYLRNHSGA